MKRRGQRVGVRELRQNLSVYLRRVEGGETLEVTDRGRPVALLAAREPGAVERLVAAGRATAPSGDLLALGMPRARKGRISLSRALEEARQERL